MTTPRTLTMPEVCRRVMALDQLYLNADRWLARWCASGRAEDRRRADLAWRAYATMRDTPFAIVPPQEGEGR